MGKHTKSSKKQKPQAKSAHKPVKRTAPKSTKAKPAHSHTVVKKPDHRSAGAKSSKPAHPPAHPPPKPKAMPAHPPSTKAKAVSPTPAAAPKGKPAPAEAADAGAKLSPDELRKQLVAKAKSRTKAQRAVAFTFDDVQGELAKARPARRDSAGVARTEVAAKAPATGPRVVTEVKPTHRRFGAASLADILGYNPAVEEKREDDESAIDKKFIRYYKLLVQLRDHVKSGLATHAEETLKRSSRDDAGDLSGYGQHMADAGTDAFDRDFALSLVSSEQEALFEIEEAIKRIKKGTYGNCELTGKPINKDRLLAVPFARYSVESQTEMEKTRRRSSQHGGLFGDAAGEEGAKITEDDSE